MRYPVIHISFGRGVVDTSDAVLDQRFRAMLDEIGEALRIALLQQHLANRFSEFIQNLRPTFNSP